MRDKRTPKDVCGEAKSNRAAMSAPHAKNDTKSLVGFCAIKLASKQKVTKF